MINTSRKRFDRSNILGGVVFIGLGLAFLAEAGGLWDFRLTQLRYGGPLLLIVIGVAVLLSSGLLNTPDLAEEDSD